MKKLILLFVLIPVFSFGDISQWNGMTINTSTNINGCPGFSSLNGATVVSASSPGTLYIYPDGDSIYNDWSALGAGNHYVEIDDNKDSPDEDTTYLSTTGNSQYDNWTIESDGGELTGKTITNVTVYFRSKASAGTPVYYIDIRVNGVNYASAGKTQSTSYDWYNNAWTQNPNTTSEWTQSDINNLIVGTHSGSIAGNTLYITTVYVKVDYE